MKRYLLGFAAALSLLSAAQVQALCLLREDTASQEIPLGPFVDSTDGDTAETGLTIANTDIKLQKGGATTQANKNSGGATHIATGDYYAVLDATDTDTPGNLRIKVKVAGALPVWLDCIVLEEAVYDRDFAASSLGYVANAPVNVAQAGGSNVTAASGRLEVNTTHAAGTAWNSGAIGAATIANASIDEATFASDTNPRFGILTTGTAQSGSTGTTLVLAAAENFTADNRPNGATCAITAGTGAGQSLGILSYVNATDTATMNGTWPTTPDNTSVYLCFRTAPGSASGGATAAQVWAYADRQLTALDEDITTFDWNATTIGTATNLTNLPAITANWLTAAGTAADFSTEINSGMATSAAISALDTKIDLIDDMLDTEIAAIKAKTDQMNFGVANQLDVNVEGMNANAICGTGDAGTPWTGCP